MQLQCLKNRIEVTKNENSNILIKTIINWASREVNKSFISALEEIKALEN